MLDKLLKATGWRNEKGGACWYELLVDAGILVCGALIIYAAMELS